MITVYLDHANWIDLAEGRVDRATFESALAEGVIIPIISHAHLLEIVKISKSADRLAVAAYLDRAESIGDLAWARTDIVSLEAIAAFIHSVTGEHTRPSVTEPTYLHVLYDGAIPSIDGSLPTDVVGFVDGLQHLDNLPKYRDLLARYPGERQMLAATREARGQRRFTDKEQREWLADELPRVVTLPSGSIIAITPDVRARFVERADLSLCPAHRAKWAFHQGWNLDPQGARSSDVPDSLHLPGVVYADIGFVDGSTWNALSTGGFEPPPRRNANFSDWLQSL